MGKPETTLALDIDDLQIYERIRDEAGIDLKQLSTFKVQGGKPSPCGHYHFGQTEASRALGNCDLRVMSRVTGKKKRTLFDVKSNNAYVVGPGSIHPDGPVYQIIDSSPIIPIPDEIVFWLEANKGAIWEDGPGKAAATGEGKSGSQGGVASRPFDLIHRVEDIIANCQGKSYDVIKEFIGKYGYAHRHEADLAIAEYLLIKEEGDVAKARKEFHKVRLHQDRSERYDQITLAKAVKYQEENAMGAAKAPKNPTTGALAFKHPAVPGRTEDYVLLPNSASFGFSRFNGWFGRGRVHIIAGSSGAGKTTFMLDVLASQRERKDFLGQRPFFAPVQSGNRGFSLTR